MPQTGRVASGGAHQSSNALIGAAVIYLVPGLLHWSIDGFRGELGDWIYAGGSAVILLMGIWARWSPIVPSIIGAVLCVAFLSLQARRIANWNLILWIINATI